MMDSTIDQSLWDKGICMVFGEIDDCTSRQVAEFILHHNLQSKCDHLQLVINSPGGCLVNSWCIVDLINISTLPVYTLGMGQVSSGALLILMAGKQGHRYVSKHCTIMTHQFMGECEGKVHELQMVMQNFQKSHEQMIEFYQQCTLLSREQILEKLLPAHDVYLKPEQALQMGMVDRIV